MLSVDQIVAARDYDVRRVDVPEWGGHVFVRPMTGRERVQWEKETVEAARAAGAGDSEEAEALAFASSGSHMGVLLRTLCDEAGKLILTREDIPKLEAKTWGVLQRVVRAAFEVSGLPWMDGSDKSDPVLDEVGNSSGDRNSAPGSDSPQLSAVQ